eukprot:2621033-Pyramimonas_sp.AAC.1
MNVYVEFHSWSCPDTGTPGHPRGRDGDRVSRVAAWAGARAFVLGGRREGAKMINAPRIAGRAARGWVT